MHKQFVSIGKVAKLLGMGIDELWKWEREERLISHRTLSSGRLTRADARGCSDPYVEHALYPLWNPHASPKNVILE